MNKEALPYLNSLYYLLTNISNLEVTSEDASMRIDLSKRLVDLMLVQNKVSASLVDECLKKLPDISLKLEKVLPKSKINKLLLLDLKKICSDSGIDI